VFYSSSSLAFNIYAVLTSNAFNNILGWLATSLCSLHCLCWASKLW